MSILLAGLPFFLPSLREALQAGTKVLPVPATVRQPLRGTMVGDRMDRSPIAITALFPGVEGGTGAGNQFQVGPTMMTEPISGATLAIFSTMLLLDNPQELPKRSSQG